VFNCLSCCCVAVTDCPFQDLASRLKAQLEAARSAKSAQGVSKTVTASEDSEVVVLSRTDRQGMSRPLPGQKHAVEPKRGRRKKEKVECLFVQLLMS